MTAPRHSALSHRDMSRAEQPSPDAAKRYRSDLQDTLEVIRKNDLLKMSALAWPAGLDRRILDGLPLRERTRNCLSQARLMEGDNPLTVYELLRIANFGRESLSDLLCTVDDFLSVCIESGGVGSPQDGRQNDVAEVPPQGSIERFGIDQSLEGGLGSAAVVAMRLRTYLESLSPRQLTIIEDRLLSTPPKTLEEVGAKFDVTRERIRQIQARTEQKMRAAFRSELRTVAEVARKGLGHIAEEGAVNRRIDALLPDDPGRTGECIKKLFRRSLIDKMGFALHQSVYLDERAREEFEEIRASIRTLADDVGLMNEEELIASLPSEEWRKFWPWVRKRCGLRELFGSLGIRDSGKARTKAALISIGRPATREEIAGMCGYSASKIGSHLSVIPSVVKADKDRWGLREWVDDEYDGITGEIVQRIEEDGGATTTERLLTELPGKFGVNPMSVRAYMQTAKFVINDGWISLASRSSIRLRDLDDVIDGRDDTGAPYWTFPVEARYFDGYSVTNVPPEIAKALGCAPDSGEHVKIENLPGCRDLSIRWPLASITGASLGYVGEPIRRLGLEPGGRVRVTIKDHCLVELTADNGNARHPRDSEANAVLKRMMQRRKVL